MNSSTVVNSNNDVEIEQSPAHKASLLVRNIRVLYAISAYSISMLGLVYFIFFVSDWFIPISVNSGPFDIGLTLAVLTNTGLLLLFGLQHSIMARPKFKVWLKQHMHPSIERATYCLATGLVLGFICCSWIPIEGVVWTVESTIVRQVLIGIGALGWTITVIATFNIDHFELFGLRQAYCQWVGKHMPAMRFKKIGLYCLVRHPIQSGLLIGMWSVPTSTLSHLMLASGMTLYIFIGLYFEEKDLIKEFGQTYRDYKKQVGKVIPFV
ncbi:NnrU family protein [Alteromonadaceae bacterium BrNp21-10]|nr:NnrU family protein [Alteromonadaceae bacterium BrNp21-10]